ncbi:MAG: SH3 domain-containing protein [Myxococcota bacterium]
MTRRGLLAATLAATLSFTAFADEKSERAAADLLHKRLQHENPQDKALLDAVKGKDIVVVRGSMDQIEDVLRAARIQHTVIDPERVARYPLSSSMILMVNCPGDMPEASLRRIEKFVRAGGLLYTTDWALANVVQRLFPKTIVHNGGSTGDEVVPVRIDQQNDNLMSRMLLRKGTDPQWWLEGGSYPIKILDSKRVEVLASSATMGKRYGATPVVVRFRHEDGEVIHVVSHFYRQLSTQGPAVAAKDAQIDGLSKSDAEDFRKSEAAEAKLGDVESSYAFQRMTSNLVTTKQKRNVELQEIYNQTVRAPAALRGAPSASAAPVVDARKGTRMKVLTRQGDQVKVRDEFGNEGWVAADDLVAH